MLVITADDDVSSEVFSWVKDINFTQIDLMKGVTQIDRAAALEAAGFRDGVLYYFENVSPKEDDLEGYWSTSSDPGQPLWPPSIAVPGKEWAWKHTESIFTVEISRYESLLNLDCFVRY
jgi:hypothetical protein